MSCLVIRGLGSQIERFHPGFVLPRAFASRALSSLGTFLKCNAGFSLTPPSHSVVVGCFENLAIKIPDDFSHDMLPIVLAENTDLGFEVRFQ